MPADKDLLYFNQTTSQWEGINAGAISDGTKMFTPNQIAVLSEEVTASPAPTALNLGYGLQVFDAPHTTPYNVMSMKGLTRINLLGRDGNCEDTSKWLTSSVTPTLDTTNKVYVTNGIKMTLTTTGTGAGLYKATGTIAALDTSKYHVAIAEVKNGNATNCYFKFALQTSALITDTTKFNLVYARATPTQVAADNNISLLISGSTGQYSYVDGVRIYQLADVNEYNAIASMTAEQIAAKYPYVDDMKPIVNPYVIRYGENLLPPFSEWVSGFTTGTKDIVSPYSFTAVKTAGGFSSYYYEVPVIAGQVYTFSCDVAVSSIGGTVGAGGYYNLDPFDANGTALSALGTTPYATTNGTTTLNKTVTIPSTAVKLKVTLSIQDAATGTFTFSNPVFNLGSVTLPTFKPRADDHLFFPNVSLASNVDGSVYDELRHWNGKYWKQARFKTMDLLGSLACVYYLDDTGYKAVQITLSSLGVPGAHILVKYDGKIATYDQSLMVGSDRFRFQDAGATLALTIADTDSGWEESYTPSVAEIQAYFYGYKMNNGTFGTAYNGSGTKTWTLWNATNNTGAVTTVPTTQAAGYTPYKLQYQLAQSTLEEIAVEGDITLHEGLNQVEVGNGMIVREKVNLQENSGIYYVNGTGGSKLKYRVLKFLDLHKDGKIDRRFSWNSTYSDALGYGVLFKPIEADDLSWAYTVTYLALDQYSLTSNVQSIQGEYASNLKTVVNTLAINQANVITRVGMLENTKAQKAQPQWIEITTLLASYTNYSGRVSSYRKKDDGTVQVRGLLVPGTITDNTVITYLPHKPLQNINKPVSFRNTTAYGSGVLSVSSIDGSLSISGLSGTMVWLALDFSYSAV